MRKELSFAEAARVGGRSLGALLEPWALVGGGVPRDRALALADVKEAIAIKEAQFESLPEIRGASAWAILQSGSPAAERLAARLREDGAEGAKLRLDAKTVPLSGTTAAEQAWLLRIQGKDAEAKALLDARAKQGVPLPAWGR